MWTRILVPHDFSVCARRALDVAVMLARQGGGELTILHISPLPPNLPRDAQVHAPGQTTRTPMDEMLVRGTERALAEIADPLRARGLTVHTAARVTEAGSPAAAILRAARDLDAHAIVLGTHGRTGLSHLLLGSVAERVVRAATIPVVTVRTRDDEPHPTREELLAEDELAG